MSRTLPLVTLVTAAAALAVTPRTGAAVNAGHSSPLTAAPVCSPAPPAAPKYCYEIVNGGTSNDYNYVTGIDNSQQIVGAYSSGTAGPYTSFLGVPLTVTQNALTPYHKIVEKDGSLSTYLGGLNDGSSSNAYLVGYVVEPPQTFGAVRYAGTPYTWGLIQDPKQGTGLCAVTEVLDIFDSRIAVGFYEQNGTGTTCVKRAFEMYSNTGFTPPYTFVDMTPTDPNGSTLDVISSMATGINILGDVVGNVTWSATGSTTRTGGWIYRALKYTTFCYGGTSSRTTSSCNANYPTFANGINFSDLVVGDFKDRYGHQNGFAILNPWEKTGAKFSILNTSDNNTVISSVNEATGSGQTVFFAGWTANDGAKSSGIVGICPVLKKVGHCGSTDTGGDR